jgi:hypothetical protein
MDFNNSPPLNMVGSNRSSALFTHILTEVVVGGGVFLYLYNKITHLENVVDTIKIELEQTKALLFQHRDVPIQHTTPLSHNFHIPRSEGMSLLREQETRALFINRPSEVRDMRPPVDEDCDGGVCKLKRVAISKVSTQRESDGNTSKVQTFTTRSPNPVLKSVTPNLSEEPENILDKVLNDIDDE